MPSDSAIGPTGPGYEVLVPAGKKSSPQDGLEYEVIVLVPGAERSIQFFVNGMTRLPRPGEKLDFDGPENDNLTLLVTEVRHAFSVRHAAEVRVYAVLDHEHSDPEDLALAQRLLDAPELKRWTGHFAMLRPDEDTIAYQNGMRSAAET